MKNHLITIVLCLVAATILCEEQVPPVDPSKDNVAATDGALIALGAGVPKFRDGFVDILIDARRVNECADRCTGSSFQEKRTAGSPSLRERRSNAGRAAVRVA